MDKNKTFLIFLRMNRLSTRGCQIPSSPKTNASQSNITQPVRVGQSARTPPTPPTLFAGYRYPYVTPFLIKRKISWTPL